MRDEAEIRADLEVRDDDKRMMHYRDIATDALVADVPALLVRVQELAEQNERLGIAAVEACAERDAQAGKVLALRAVVDAVREQCEQCEQTPYGEHGDYGAPVVFANDILQVIAAALGAAAGVPKQTPDEEQGEVPASMRPQVAAVDDDPEHFPWHYTEYGVVCACGRSMRDEVCPAAAVGVPELPQCGKPNAPGMEFNYTPWQCGRPLDHAGRCSPFASQSDPAPVDIDAWNRYVERDRLETFGPAGAVPEPTEEDPKAAAHKAAEAAGVTFCNHTIEEGCTGHGDF